jgi:hypothetical protein
MGIERRTKAPVAASSLHTMVKYCFVLLIAMLAIPCARAQKQLVLLKKEKVVLRLYPGDDIVFKTAGSKHPRTSYVNNLSDTAVVIHNDTIAYHNIERLYYRQIKFYNVLGSLLVIGGVGFTLVDQVNEIIVQGNKPSLDQAVSRISIPSIVIGLPMMLIHKKSQRLNGKYHLLMVKPGSIFYKENPSGYQSPYIP